MEDKCCERTKHRETKEYKDLVNRLISHTIGIEQF